MGRKVPRTSRHRLRVAAPAEQGRQAGGQKLQLVNRFLLFTENKS